MSQQKKPHKNPPSNNESQQIWSALHSVYNPERWVFFGPFLNSCLVPLPVIQGLKHSNIWQIKHLNFEHLADSLRALCFGGYSLKSRRLKANILHSGSQLWDQINTRSRSNCLTEVQSVYVNKYRWRPPASCPCTCNRAAGNIRQVKCLCVHQQR